MATRRPPRGPNDGRPGRPGPPKRRTGPGQGGPHRDRQAKPSNPEQSGPRLARIDAEGDDREGLDRLQKVLAHAGIGSRRACEDLIVQGRVSVNGKVVRELGTKVNLEADKVELDGQKIKAEAPVYIAVYKPKGYVSTTSDPAGRPRVVDLVPDIPERVYNVGRLDEQSVGLMLLTNDGELANKLAHPKYGVEKIYRVVVAGHPDQDVFNRLVEGVWLAEGKVRAKHVRAVGKRGDSTILEMVLAEGKNREVRRMLAKFGHKVMSLTRVAVGPISIQSLKPGHFRFLSPYEVDLLRKAAAGISVPTSYRPSHVPVRQGRTSRPARPAGPPGRSPAGRPPIDSAGSVPPRNSRPGGPRPRGAEDSPPAFRPRPSSGGPYRRTAEGQGPGGPRPRPSNGGPSGPYRRPPEPEGPTGPRRRPPESVGNGRAGGYRRPPAGQGPAGPRRRPPEEAQDGPRSSRQGGGPRPGPGGPPGPRRPGPSNHPPAPPRPPRMEPPVRRIIGLAPDSSPPSNDGDRSGRPAPRRRPPGRPKPMAPRKRPRPGASSED